jgi:hypothetical protein
MPNDAENRENLENLDAGSAAPESVSGESRSEFRPRLSENATVLSETYFSPAETATAPSIRSSARAGVAAAPPASASSGAAAPPAARTFRVIRTDELDSYEDPMPIEDLVALRFSSLRADPPTGDRFRGSARKAAKLSVADAEMEEFDDLRDLIETLPSHKTMVNHNPPITPNRNSNRVAEENRNVRVRAFLYAASRENDNDFHLIIGRSPEDDEMYMNVEISGLPPSNSPYFPVLKRARDAYKNFFGGDLPGFSYDFYDPPIPVEVEGSLFFDMSHATGQKPGSSSLRDDIPTVWEIHPITSIRFE